MGDINEGVCAVNSTKGKKWPTRSHLSRHFKNRDLKLQNCTLPDTGRADTRPERWESWGEGEGRRTTISLSKIASGENGIRAGSSLETCGVIKRHQDEVA